MSVISFTPSLPSSPRPAAPLTVRAGNGEAAVVAEVKNTLSVMEAAKSAAPVPTSPLQGSKAAPNAPANALSKEEVARQVHELQAKMDKFNPALAFVVDQASGRALIQLTDRATKEVILQFPSEAALQISKALDQFQKGLVLNRTV